MMHTTGKNLFIYLRMQGASLQSLCLYGWGSFTRQTVLIYLAEVVEIIIIDEDVFAAVIRDLHGVVDLLDKAAGLLDIVGVEENIAEGWYFVSSSPTQARESTVTPGMAAISSSPSMEAMTPSLFVQSI